MSRDDGCHKIGRSVNPLNRAAQLRCHLVWTIRTGDMVWLESYLHRAFAECRKDGEWFDLPNWVVDELVAVDLIHDETHITDWLKNRHTANTERLAVESAKSNPIYLRIDASTDAALSAFIAKQPAPPERTVVTLTALHKFLAEHGCYPPPPKR